MNNKPSSVLGTRHSRIFALNDLQAYHGTGLLDMTFWLPGTETEPRRLWMLTPATAPVVRVNDSEFPPRDNANPRGFRWVDYGVVDMPLGFSQLRVSGISVPEAASSHLVVSSDPEMTFSNEMLEEAERKLWGISRAEAGKTTISPSRVPVGEPVTFTVRYEAGPCGLPAGALVRFSIPKAFDLPQTGNPEATGFTIISPGTPVQICTIESSEESHEKTDIICRLDQPFAAGDTFELSYRTDRTFLFPQIWSESERKYWYSNTPPLNAATALGNGRLPVSLLPGNTHSVTFAAGPPERLHLTLPGRRFCTEQQLELRGVFTDHFRNIPEGGAPDTDFDVLLLTDGREVWSTAPQNCFASHHTFRIVLPSLTPGVYRAEARKKNGKLLARSNPMELLPEDSTTEPIFWGEIHAHTERSDGSGTYEKLWRHAREVGCLEFAAAADHACYFSDNEWRWMQDVTNRQNEKGRFVTLVGYEWAGRQVHRNVYTSRERLQLFRGMYGPQRNLNTVWNHFHGDREVVGGPHGGLAHGLKWDLHDPDVERFIEIYSMWGASDIRDNPLIPNFAKTNPNGLSANDLLQQGAKLGFTGGGDCHEAHPGFSSEDPNRQGQTPHAFAAVLLYRCGLTAAVMPELSRKAMIHALRERKTYATTGARMLLDFNVSGIPMGSEGSADIIRCQATVHAQDALQTVEIIRNGETVWKQDAAEFDTEIEWEDPAAPARESYFYLHVIQKDGQQAWSSPVWITAG
ncbi:CehA/McbA family metallohydrolase [Tichowtungia aerotolerans]|uniref:DUF3604 domain-containing protein n=1 Tax=Tichowtungia aerotolerans TaxID=2697043 RepID=A0A6P1ME80_9BACT|nr:CehA/McbA family metallohydrolase [Tichowtungia aerotolerans]QHI69395.1 DUF3604 domain-containing protein [Tichowtungia aerotolerans]